jgi:hypothetical protein
MKSDGGGGVGGVGGSGEQLVRIIPKQWLRRSGVIRILTIHNVCRIGGSNPHVTYESD